jgi:hypothetical protein
MMLSLMAVYENQPEQQWIVQQAVKDLAYVNQWLPEDGTCHEGPGYLIFGGNHLTLAMDAADRCLGTSFLQHPYFKNAGLFRIHSSTPGWQGSLRFGDTGTGSLGYYHNFLLKGAAVNEEADVKDGLLTIVETEPKTYAYGWFSLLWDDPALKRGDVTQLDPKAFWPDVGVATLRESWAADSASARFKCGPFGGYKLNEFRELDNRYINVAHDDPDANSFILTRGPTYLAETDGYSKRKASRNHNTILINGMGQMTEGRAEGGVWSQPGGDMAQMAVITAWRNQDRIVAVEGEAAGSYLAYRDKKTGKSRPALDRFRRTFLWVEGDYILVLDDIRAPSEVEVDWLMQGHAVETADLAKGQFVLRNGSENCPFQVVSTKPLQFKVVDSPADHRGESMGFKQLRATASLNEVSVASVYDLWNRGDLKVTLTPVSDTEYTVEVTGQGVHDSWNWQLASAQFTAATLNGKRQQGSPAGFPFVMTPENSQPPQE